MTPEEQKLVDAAREYDAQNRPRGNWQSVPPEQVLRLLTGAKLASKDAYVKETDDVNVQIRNGLTWIRKHYGPDRESV